MLAGHLGDRGNTLYFFGNGGSHAITALAASGSAVTGINSVQIQASQQFLVRSLPSG